MTKTINRRQVLQTGAAVSGALSLSSFSFAGKTFNEESLSFLMNIKNKAVGCKITTIDKDRLLMTVREIGGKKLTSVILNSSDKNSKGGVSVSTPDKKHSIWDATDWDKMREKGFIMNFKTDFPGLSISTPAVTPPANDVTANGLFSFFRRIKNAIKDIFTVGLAIGTWLTGNDGSFLMSGGGLLNVSGSFGSITYDAGVGFMLPPPGTKVNPWVWY